MASERTSEGWRLSLKSQRLPWGEDRIEVSSGRLVVTSIRGPFRSARVFGRDAIQRIVLAGRDDRLTLVTARKRIELSGLGTRTERFEGATALRAELGLREPAAGPIAIPRGWEEIITPEGERALTVDLGLRRIRAWGAGAGALLMAGLAFLVARQSGREPPLVIPALILLAFTLALAAGALWLARVRWEWRVGNGRLTLRKRYGATLRDAFEARRLVLEMTTDSDGDVWYVLQAVPAATPPTPNGFYVRIGSINRTVARRMNDGSAMRDLGEWLARASGLEFVDYSAPRTRETNLAELRAALEQSGPLGEWAAKLVERLGEQGKKTG
jgi:hypothetical protein